MIYKRGVMVRWILLSMLALLLSATALAETDVVLDKTISHGTKVILNETTYEVQIGSSNHSLVRLVAPDNTIILEEGECVTRRYSEFCYIEYTDTQEIDANLTDARPILETDRDIDSRSLDVGESTNISITFENVGGSVLTDFYFFELVPSTLKVVSAAGCSIDDENSQRIILDDNLYPDEPVTCTYTVQASVEGITTFYGKFLTEQLVQSKDAEAVPQVSITAKKVFVLDISSSKFDLDVGQPFVLTFDLENLESGSSGDNLSIHRIELDLDEQFAVKKEYDSEFYTFSNSNVFRFAGVLEPEEELSQRVELVPLVPDKNLSLVMTINYSIGSQDPIVYSRLIEFTQEFIPLSCEYVVVDDAGNNLVSLNKLNHTLPGFDRGELFVDVLNQNSYVSFDDVSFSDSGDIDFPSRSRFTSLRKNSKEILTSKQFSFDRLSSFRVPSSVTIKYAVLGEQFEASCDGSIFVEKSSFLLVSKNISFVEIAVDGSQKKLFPQIDVVVKNDFFLPIKNVELVEILPAQIFSNNNTRKSFSLATLEENKFSYNFIVPEDYVSIDGKKLVLETLVSYEVYGSSFTDTVSLSVDVNDVLSAQEGVVIDTLIDSKVQQLKDELNESIVNSTKPIYINVSQPPVLYAPFLNYLSYGLIVFLFFLAVIFLNIKYGFVHAIHSWLLKRKAKKIKKKEEEFASKFRNAASKEKELEKELLKQKKELVSLERSLKKKEFSFKKQQRSLQVHLSAIQQSIEKDHRLIKHLESQKSHLEKQMASAHRSLTFHEKKKEDNQITLSKEKSLVQDTMSKIDASKKSIKELSSQIANLDKEKSSLKKDFESSIDKNEAAKKTKLKNVKQTLSDLDKEYGEKRKVLKEEQAHLEHSDS